MIIFRRTIVGIIFIVGLVSAVQGNFAAASFYVLLGCVSAFLNGFVEYKEKKTDRYETPWIVENTKTIKVNQKECENQLEEFIKNFDSSTATGGLILIAHPPDDDNRSPVTALMFGTIDELKALSILGIKRVHALEEGDINDDNNGGPSILH